MNQSRTASPTTRATSAMRPVLAPARGALADLQQAVGNHAFVGLMAPLRIQAKAAHDDMDVQVAAIEVPATARPAVEGGVAKAGASPGEATSPRQDAIAPFSFVVEDDVRTAGPGQLARGIFLQRVRAAVCAAANKGFEGTGRTADDCPWIEHWLGQYEAKDAAHLDRSVRKLAPETARASSADDAIAMIAVRVRRSVEVYVATGGITGVPDGISPEIPGMNPIGALFGAILRKSRAGRAEPKGGGPSAHDPQAVQARLGAGQPLPSSVRSRMGAAFGVSFSGVRMHDDAESAALSAQLDARAFAVGEHVAFGAGEYRPGTPIGDALIAHELAHTIQQGGAEAAQTCANDSPQLEAEADRAAIAVTASLWREGRGPEDAGRVAAPRSRSGLRLSRCSPKAQGPGAKTAIPKPADVNQPKEEKPPNPEDSYWFEDPRKQVKDTDGNQTMDFGKKGEGGGTEITNTGQTRHQVIVDKPSQYSHVDDVEHNNVIAVRFAYSALGFSSGRESKDQRDAKAAVLAALRDVIHDVANFGAGALSWENAEEKKKLLANRKVEEENRARMSELFRAYPDSNPMNIYLAPETEAEFRTGQYIPTTAQVWVNMADVGDAAKLKTALRIPLHHALGGANPAAGASGMDQPADMKRTMIHESVHALLLNRSADYTTVWNEAQAKIKLTGPADLQKKTMDLLRAYLLAQEELFAYSTEEILYPPVASGPQASGKPGYEIFMNQARLFFTKKSAAMQKDVKKIDVAERVGGTKKTPGKKVPWQIAYEYPQAIALAESDKEVLDLVLSTWPLK